MLPAARLAVALALVVTGATACDVGSVLPRDEFGVDGAVGTDGGAGGDGASVACEPVASQLPNGEHNPGQACLTCHNGQTATRFTLGGTVFTTAQSATPVPAATIIVTDANNVVTKLITASNGNFYSARTFAYPVKVTASKCPDTRPMIAEVATAGGDCNTCHQPGQSGRVFLP